MWPENLRAWSLFLVASDCWVHAGMAGVPVRYDLGAAREVWDQSGMGDRSPEEIDRVRCVAQAALEEIRRKVREDQDRERRKAERR